MTAQRIESSIKIDGVPDTDYWGTTEAEYTFIQNQPDNGTSASRPTQVKVYYNDKGVYITARMQDPDPQSIAKEFGLRDDNNRNSDVFAIYIETYNKGQNALIFGVTAAGVQLDATITNGNNFDFNWDAVWKSAVKIDEQGWTAELEIPYYALRFPKQDVQTWGINFFRRIQATNERTYWNFIDRNVQGFVNQFGELDGPNHDKNFNAFNMNLTYSWQIAPGSFVSAVWRNGINTDSNILGRDYFRNLEDLFQSSQFNSFSVRVTYFLDYLTVKNSLRSKRS